MTFVISYIRQLQGKYFQAIFYSYVLTFDAYVFLFKFSGNRQCLAWWLPGTGRTGKERTAAAFKTN